MFFFIGYFSSTFGVLRTVSNVLSRMKLSYDKNLVESVIPNPESLPYILKNELVNFYITFKGQLDSKAKIELTY